MIVSSVFLFELNFVKCSLFVDEFIGLQIFFYCGNNL